MKHLLGIDGGGTRTKAAVADACGVILGRGEAGGSNYHSVGLDTAIDNIRAAADAAREDAGVTECRYAAACTGLAGLGRPVDFDTMRPKLEALGFADEIMLYHDARIALAGATEGRPGVIVIAGTGSIAFGVNNFGEEARVGGWGPLLDDEGSAYWIGVRALRAAWRAHDGRGLETSLLSTLCDALGAETPTRVEEMANKGELDRKRVAALASHVHAAAVKGDAVAADILRDAGEQLAIAAIAVARKLDMTVGPIDIAYAGGVFSAGDWVLAPFRDRVRDACPNASVSPPRLSAVEGAIILARDSLS